MRCRFPIDAWQSAPGAPLVFKDLEGERHDYKRVTIACGQCNDCRLARSRAWAVRCLHEASLYDFNVFVTLTYDDSHLPESKSLVYRDFQLFMKRLRRTGRKARFYMCGEYGEENGRPHYHAILFNCWFPDMRYWRMSPAGFKLYRSAELEKLWFLGNAEIGMVTFESAAYVARYVMKKLTGNGSEKFYEILNVDTGEIHRREKEFNRMSLKPGIGAAWYKKFKSDVYPHGMVVVNGVETSPPRYYDKMFAMDDPEGADQLRDKREFSASLRRFDNTVERRAVKAQVSDARLSLLKRS